MSPAQMRMNLQKVKDSMIIIAGECMKVNETEIVQLLVTQQQSGIDSENNQLREYSFAYKTIRRERGLGENTILRFTGETQDDMVLVIEGENYRFYSPTRTEKGELKTDWLNRWNEQAGGATTNVLSSDMESAIYPIIKDLFCQRVQEELAWD